MRIALKTLALLIALAVLGLCVVLLPAHLQVRRIAPPLPDAAALRALTTVAGGPVSVEYLEIAEQPTPRGLLGHNAFLLRWADGRAFLIDAGMDEATAADFARLLARIWDAGEGRFRADVATQLGADIAAVRGVGFTHLHIDHSQGVVPFCAARGPGAVLYQTRWQAEAHNFNTTEGAALLRESCLEPRVLAEGAQSLPAEFPGLAIIALGGHTPGSTLFAARVGARLWLFSGDTTNTRAEILEDRPKAWWYSLLLVPEDTRRTAELRAWLRELDSREDVRVIVSHDASDIAASGLPRHAGHSGDRP